jgi:hypothetical protein
MSPQNKASGPEAYAGLRKMVLGLDAAKIENKLEIEGSVRGIVEDLSYPAGVMTLVALADATVSLYLSSGGGIIGLGAQELPRKLAQEALRGAGPLLEHFSPAEDIKVPQPGNVRIRLLMTNGTVMFEAREEELGYKRVPVWRLFHQVQKLLTLAQMTMQKQVKKQ